MLNGTGQAVVKTLAAPVEEDSRNVLRFSADGRRLAGFVGGRFRCWEIESGQEFKVLDDREAVAFELIEAGQTLVTYRENQVRGVTVDTNEERFAWRPSETQADPALSIAFSTTTPWSATGAKGGRVFLRETRSGRIAAEVRAGEKAIVGLVFSPDGSTLAAVDEDRTLTIWKVGDLAAVAGETKVVNVDAARAPIP